MNFFAKHLPWSGIHKKKKKKCDKICTEYNVLLNHNHSTPDAISHKDLNSLLAKAKKEIPSIKTTENHEIIEDQEFNDLIIDWTKTSRKILLMLNNKDQVLTKHKNSKSFIAFGAMGAHINMALQALKATESDQ